MKISPKLVFVMCCIQACLFHPLQGVQRYTLANSETAFTHVLVGSAEKKNVAMVGYNQSLVKTLRDNPALASGVRIFAFNVFRESADREEEMKLRNFVSSFHGEIIFIEGPNFHTLREYCTAHTDLRFDCIALLGKQRYVPIRTQLEYLRPASQPDTVVVLDHFFPRTHCYRACMYLDEKNFLNLSNTFKLENNTNSWWVGTYDFNK